LGGNEPNKAFNANERLFIASRRRSFVSFVCFVRTRVLFYTMNSYYCMIATVQSAPITRRSHL
jgi:hypothetical protein